MKQRLDKLLVERRLVTSRSQAEDLIRRGFVKVDGQEIIKPGFMVSDQNKITVNQHKSFVSRAGEKLYSVIKPLNLTFKDKVVLDVGSSTGGFTDVVLQAGAKKVIAIDVGTDQLHPRLRNNQRIELHEKTDIRRVTALSTPADVVVIDVSFISLRDILPQVARLVRPQTAIIAMVKPQFEAGSGSKHKGVIKNDHMRREILKDFENWAQKLFVIQAKADSEVSGVKGNRERFYLLKQLRKE